MNPKHLRTKQKGDAIHESMDRVVNAIIPKKKKAPKSEKTRAKILRGVLFQGLLNIPHAFLKHLIDAIRNIIIFILNLILEAPDPVAICREIRDKMVKIRSKNECIGSDPSITQNAMHHTEASLIDQGIENSIALLKKYRHLKGFPKKLILIVDANCKAFWGKIKNKLTGWMKKGQADLWVRSRNCEGFYFGNVPIFICEAIVKVCKKPRNLKDLPIWIETCTKILVALEHAGFTVEIIMADRGYFDAIGFAMTGLNAWNHGKGLRHPPKLMTPQQFAGKGNVKTDLKWQWLMDPTISEVKEYTMTLKAQDIHLLPNNIAKQLDLTPDGDYLVRTTRVLSFDLNKKNDAKSRAWAHKEALKIADRIKTAKAQFDAALVRFKLCYLKVQKKPLKKNPTFPKTGLPKRIYKDKTLQAAHLTLWNAYKIQTTALKAKTALINRVMVTVISIPPGQPLSFIADVYKSLNILYTLRWRIENAFKALKYDFDIPSAGNGIIRLLYARTCSIILLNEYNYSRILNYRSKLRKNDLAWPEEDDEFHPHNFMIQPKIAAGLTRTEWKMAVFEREMKNWIQMVVCS